MMPCDHVDFGNGTRAVICGHRPPAKKCYVCGAPAPYLCDFRLSHPAQITHVKTCDKPVCERHRTPIAPNVDYCPDHAEREAVRTDGAPSGQGGLFPKETA